MKRPLPQEHSGQKAPDEEFHRFALRVRTEQGQERQTRLDLLTPLLDRIEKATRTLHPDASHPQFSGERVKFLLEMFLPPSSSLDESTLAQHISHLKRTVRKASLLSVTSPVPYSDALEQLAREKEEELPLYQRMAGRSHRKCRFTSEAVIALAAYVQRCLPATKAATRYRLIGKIITQVSTPFCLVCGTPHRFMPQDWRKVRARDTLRPAQSPAKE